MTDVAPDQVLGMAREWVELDMPLNHEVAMSIVRGLLARDQAVRPVLDAAKAWSDDAGNTTEQPLLDAVAAYRAAAGGSAEADESLCGNIEEGVGEAPLLCTRPPHGTATKADPHRNGRGASWWTDAAAPAVASGDDTISAEDVRAHADLLRAGGHHGPARVLERLAEHADQARLRALAEAGAPAQPGTDVIARLTAARDAGRATAERMYRGHPVEAEQADSWRDALDDLDYLATVLEAPHDDVARAILAALAGAADTEEPEEVPWFRCGNRPAAHHVRTSDLHWGGTVLSTDCGTVVTADEIADARPGQLTCRVCEAAARRANRPSFVLPEHPDALDLDAALAGRTNEEKTDV